MMTLINKSGLDAVDLPALAALIAGGGLNARDPDLLARAYRHSAFCWFGYKEGRLIATARAISDLTWCSYVADLVVAPECQGKGYGGQLLRAIQQQLLPFGKIFIYSTIDKTDFYRHYGFELLSTGMVYASRESLFTMRRRGYITPSPAPDTD